MRLKLFVCFIAMLFAFTSGALAQKYQPAGDNWIKKWWGLDLVVQNGGFNAAGPIDYISDGTGGKHKQTTVSTMKGLPGKDVVVKLPKNGGDLKWDIVTINPNDDKNMSTSHGKVDESNITWYGIVVIRAAAPKNTKMHVAHDDWAQLWLNGKDVYSDPNWTTGVQITRPKEISLNKGDNALLFKCSESGGADYINLHFEKGDTDLKILPTEDDKFFEFISAPVEPESKLATTWGEIKKK
jgi:hypothetical protein